MPFRNIGVPVLHFVFVLVFHRLSTNVTPFLTETHLWFQAFHVHERPKSINFTAGYFLCIDTLNQAFLKQSEKSSCLLVLMIFPSILVALIASWCLSRVSIAITLFILKESFLGKVKSSKFCSSTQSTRWSQLWEVCWISWSRMFNFSKGSQEECDLHKYLYCNHLNLFNAQYKANQCNCDSTSGFCFR